MFKIILKSMVVFLGTVFLSGFGVSGAEPIPYTPTPRTLLLDHFEDNFVPDNLKWTHPAVMRDKSKARGGTPSKGVVFSEGKFGKGITFSGDMNIEYPGGGNIDINAGEADFWVKLNYDSTDKKLARKVGNQVLLQILTNNKHGRVEIFYGGLNNSYLWGFVIGTKGNIIGGTNFRIPYWKKGEWHHVTLKWGKRLELWLDGAKGYSKEWNGLFGPMKVNPENVSIQLGSWVRMATSQSLFTIDEFRILGPRGGESPNRPLLTAPRLSRAPVIDGKLSGKEWDAAARVTGFLKFSEDTAAKEQTIVYIGYDKNNLYLAYDCLNPEKTPLLGKVKKHDAFIFFDDAVDVYLQPNPKIRNYDQLAVNSIGTKFDVLIKGSITAAGGRNLGFNPRWRVKTSREGDHWIAEMSIPFKELKVNTPKVGEVWLANFTRDSGGTSSGMTSWSYINGNPHRKGVFGEIIFGGARAMRLGEIKGLTKGNISTTLGFSGGPFEPLIKIKARIINSSAHPVYNYSALLADYKTAMLRPAPLTTGDYVLTLEAKIVKGKEIFYKRLPFSVSRKFATSVAGYPYAGKLWITYNLRGIKKAIAGLGVKTDLVKDGKSFGRAESRDFKEGMGLADIDIKNLPPGEYKVVSVVEDASGKELFKDSKLFREYKRPVWWHSRAGINHTVPPPWTAVKSRPGSIRIYGRDYRGTGVLPGQIVNQGKEMLAGPITLMMKSGGKSIDLAGISATDISSPDDRAVRTSSVSVGRIKVRLLATTAFDGMMRLDIFLQSPKAVIKSLILDIPLKKEFASFILPSIGRIATPQRMPSSTWKSHFLPCLWVGNDDMGLTWFSDSDQYYTPKDGEELEIVPSKERVTMRINIIRTPRVIKGKARITFGLMATPVRPRPKQRPFFLRNGEPDGTYGNEFYDINSKNKGAMRFSEYLTYPAEGNLNPRRGTIEFWAAPTASGGWPRDIFQIRRKMSWNYSGIKKPGDFEIYLQEKAGNKLELFIWDPLTGAHVVAKQDKGISSTILSGTAPSLKEGKFSHFALTYGDGVRLYVDGKLVGANPGKLSISDFFAGNLKQARLGFGCASEWKGNTGFIFDEIRISKTIRYHGRSFNVPKAPFTPDRDTLLLDHLNDVFVPDGQADGETRAAVISADSGELGGVPTIGTTFAKGKFGKGLSIRILPVKPALEQLKEWGVNFWNPVQWLEKWPYKKYGWPPDVFNKPEHGIKVLRDTVSEYHKYGIRLAPYAGYYGINAPTRLSRQFGDEWEIIPRSTLPHSPPKGHYFLNVSGKSGFADYMAAGTEYLIKTYGFDGVYLDGNAHVFPDENRHHGSGYYDENGVLHPTYAIFATRAYLERMYKIIKRLKGKKGLLIEHSSFDLIPPILSFADVYFSGEHENYTNLLNWRVRWQGTQWGWKTSLLGPDAHDYNALDETYALLYGVDIWPMGSVGRNDSERKTVNLWKAYEIFGVESAVWIPYYRAEKGMVKTPNPELKTSLYLKKGKEVMLVVGNLGKSTVDTVLNLDLAAMGLKGENLAAQNMLTRRKLLFLKEGELKVHLSAKSFILLWIK